MSKIQLRVFPAKCKIARPTEVYMLARFSRMRSEGSRFTWGSGGEAVFAKFCVCVRNRRQPFATVRNRLRWRCKALHSGERVWRGPETVSNWVVLSAFAEEVSVRVICVAAVILVFAEEVSMRVTCGAAVILVSAERCLWEWPVAPQLYWCLQRRCLWEWCVAPQLFWRLQRRCLWEWSVAPQFIGVCRGGVCESDLCQVRVSYKGVKQECLTRVSSKIVFQECPVRVSYKSVT